MDAIGESIMGLVDLCRHVRRSHHHHKKHKNLWRLVVVLLVVLTMLSLILGFAVYATLRCIRAYQNPVFDGKVKSVDNIPFPVIFVCTSERVVQFEKNLCVVDDDWTFDISSFTGDGVPCGVNETVTIPPNDDDKSNHRLPNWHCTIFNFDGSANASASIGGIPTMHIAFDCISCVRPLVAFLVDADTSGGDIVATLNDAEPSFVFGAYAEVYTLIRKSVTSGIDNKANSVKFTTTVSSTTRSLPDISGRTYTYLSFSYSSFDVTMYEKVYTYNWYDALAAVGGAMAISRVIMLCFVPRSDPQGANHQPTTANESGKSSVGTGLDMADLTPAGDGVGGMHDPLVGDGF